MQSPRRAAPLLKAIGEPITEHKPAAGLRHLTYVFIDISRPEPISASLTKLRFIRSSNVMCVDIAVMRDCASTETEGYEAQSLRP
jgi:hypothetical protein